jgi:hypothetical protein
MVRGTIGERLFQISSRDDFEMSDEQDQKSKADRRYFLEQCGRFAIVTPPVVTLMLASDGTRTALAASGKTIKTTSTTTMATSTTTVTSTAMPTSTTTVTSTAMPTSTTTVTSTAMLTSTTTVTSTFAQMMQGIGSDAKSELYMTVDSMAVMKFS